MSSSSLAKSGEFFFSSGTLDRGPDEADCQDGVCRKPETDVTDGVWRCRLKPEADVTEGDFARSFSSSSILFNKEFENSLTNSEIVSL